MGRAMRFLLGIPVVILLMQDCAAVDRSVALGELQCGVTFGFSARRGYFDTPEAVRQVEEMARTGVRWVCLVATVFQEEAVSTCQFMDFECTPGDDELVRTIGRIHAKGMKVQLRPMLECLDGEGRLSVYLPKMRTRMPGRRSTRATRWFEGMRKRAVHYARIAEKTGCELYCLDSELDRIISFNDEWKGVVAAVREVYSGPVTSCHTLYSGGIDFFGELGKKDHWFYDLDLLLLSTYAPAAKEGEAGLSVEQMMVNLAPHREHIRKIAKLYGKPVLLGECGCTSSTGASAHPSSWDPGQKFDGEEQARYMEALFRTFWNEPWFYGFYWWKWDEQVDRPLMRNDPAGDKGFVIAGKPAQEVMKRWFTRTDTARDGKGLR